MRMDLLDRVSLAAAVLRVLGEWGRIDVLVNNAVHWEPEHNKSVLDVSMRTLELEIEANVLAPVALTKLVLPGMLQRGVGTIVDLTSAAGYMDPPMGVDKGGWPLGYALGKGAFHRIAGMIALELGGQGIRSFNVQPGFVWTERGSGLSGQ